MQIYGGKSKSNQTYLCSTSGPMVIYKLTVDGLYTNQDAPFDKKTFNQLVLLGFETCDMPTLILTNPPFISSINPAVVGANQTSNITITGSGFEAGSTVIIGGVTVNSVTYIDPTTLIVNVTGGATANIGDVEVTNSGGSDVEVNAFEVVVFTGIDLRAGNTYTTSNGNPNGTTDILMRTGMTMSQDANGMFFAGANPWQSRVLFNNQSFTRASNSTVKRMFSAPTAAMMIGIGSNAINPTANDQYRQMETEAYFNSSTNLWGLYGNNGTVGGTGNQGNGTAISSVGFYRVEFTNSGSAGGTFSIYQVPDGSLGSFFDTSNLLSTFTIGGSLNPNEVNLMPSIIPRVSGQRFIFLEVL